MCTEYGAVYAARLVHGRSRCTRALTSVPADVGVVAELVGGMVETGFAENVSLRAKRLHGSA